MWSKKHDFLFWTCSIFSSCLIEFDIFSWSIWEKYNFNEIVVIFYTFLLFSLVNPMTYQNYASTTMVDQLNEHFSTKRLVIDTSRTYNGLNLITQSSITAMLITYKRVKLIETLRRNTTMFNATMTFRSGIYCLCRFQKNEKDGRLKYSDSGNTSRSTLNRSRICIAV